MQSTSKASPSVEAAANAETTGGAGRSNAQDRYGNSFLQEQLGAGGGGHSHGNERTTKDMPSAKATGPLGAPTKADVDAADQFVDHGEYGPKTITPKTGLGGFDAEYDPAAGDGELGISVRGAVHFIDPVKDDGSGKAVATKPAYDKIAKALNKLPTDERASILPEFSWTSDTTERQNWIDRLKETIHDKWSEKHQFHVHRPGWTWVGSTVDVNVDVVARDDRKAEDHVSIDAVKTPDAQNLYNYGMSSSVSSYDKDNPNDTTMQIASTDLDERPTGDILDIVNVYFATGSAVLSAAEQKRVKMWARTFQGDPTHKASHAIKALVEGHTDSVGDADKNQALSQRRVDHVLGLLREHGFTNLDGRLQTKARGEDQMKADDEENKWARRVMIKIDNPEGTQVLAAHEFGHVFGLGDQYAVKDKKGRDTSVSGTGDKTGEAAAHDGLARNMLDESGNPLAGAIVENNDGMMSGGNKVYAEDYATFHQALRELTAVDEWALGAPQARPDPATLDVPKTDP